MSPLGFIQKKSVFFIFLTIVLSLPTHAITLAQKVDSVFHPWNRETSPGCSVAIVKDGEIIFEKGYGMANLKYGIPNTPETVFQFASNSKQFTAFAVLLLEEDGLLSTQDEVQMYIPEFPDFGYPITLQNLLDHTSGLRDHLELMAFAGWNFLEDLITVQHGLNFVKRMTALNFPPGDQFMYSNTGFMLLAEIVARVSGKTFAEFTQERIFTPLGMTHSLFKDNNHLIVKNYADAYLTIPKGDTFLSPENFASVGEAGLHSTVLDIVKWDRNFYDPKIGSRSILDKMHKNALLNDGHPSPLSIGLIVVDYKGKKLVYHGGDLGGYHSQIVRFPDERLSIITAANTAGLDSNTLLNHSVTIADFYFSNPAQTSIPDFSIHEPSLQGWGSGNTPWYSPDLETVQLWSDLYNASKISESLSPAKVNAPQLTPTQAQEFVGLYYSKELDSFLSISFDGTANLLFQLNRNPQPYLFSAQNIRNNKIIVNETDLLTGKFIRNAANEVIGFTISNPRVIDLEYRKAEIVTKK